MIQLNLLPEVKTKYIKAERTKRLAVLSALTISGVAIGITIILAGVLYGTQRASLNSLDKNIKQSSSQLQAIDGLNKILTIQNQLGSLTSLHNQKPVTSRLLVFLPQITPADVNISNIGIKFEDNSINITGTAPSLEAVNKFIDTIKFTNYTTDSNKEPTRAFSAVVLSSFSVADAEAMFTITANFDPLIFSGDNNTVILAVPKMTTTRSQTEQPDTIFKEQPVMPEPSEAPAGEEEQI